MKALKQFSAVTLQEQLHDELLKQIKSGQYPPGHRIPSEMQLSAMYNISRVTVRNAIQQLVDENILMKRHGKGTFVKVPVHTEEVYTGGSFTDTCLRMNAAPSTKIIECKTNRMSKEIASLFDGDDTQCIEIKRVRLVDDTPCIIEIDYFPIAFQFLLTQSLEKLSLLKLVSSETGIRPSNFEDHFSIIYANKEFSDLLKCSLRTPLLEVTQRVLTFDNKTIYVNKQYILTSKYIYAVRSSK